MIQILNDVIYDKTKLATDIYFSDQPANGNKVMLFWHGGGWFRGDKSNLKELCSKIAHKGFTVFVPNYSLAPQKPFPAAHRDSISFVKWLLASDYTHGQTQGITQIGASSGGVMALYIAGKYGFPTVTWSAPVSYSKWIKEHKEVKASPEANKKFGYTNMHDINNSFYKYFALTYANSEDEKTLKKIDASSYDYQNLQQLLMINSTDELSPTDYLLDFIANLAKENHGVDLKLIPGNRHAMTYSTDFLDESVKYLTNAINPVC